MKQLLHNNRGITLIEVFLSISLLVVLVTSSLDILFPAVREAEIGRQRLQASWLLQEQEEGVRQIRNENWELLTPGTYFVQYNPTASPPTLYQGWQLIPGAGVKYGFTEQVVITIPDRVNENQLSNSSGSADDNMRKIVASISWPSFGDTYSLAETSYISNWQPF
jgi:Tfp pilus assembly protein PilV